MTWLPQFVIKSRLNEDTKVNLKELKKLADTCRKAGITHFKNEHYEFTLTDEVPVTYYKKNKEAKAAPAPDTNTKFETDSLTEDELLFWSTSSPISTEDNT